MNARLLYEENGVVNNTYVQNYTEIGWLSQDNQWHRRTPIYSKKELERCKEYGQLVKTMAGAYMCKLSPQLRTYESPGRERTSKSIQRLINESKIG